jgi:hypothetical protein
MEHELPGVCLSGSDRLKDETKRCTNCSLNDLPFEIDDRDQILAG